MKKIIAGFCTAVLLFGLASCATMNNAERGALIGAGGGAVVGGLIGKMAGNTLMGALIGAAVGGAAGAFIGNYMDRQAAEIRRDLEGARVDRIGEGIKITFESGLLFDIDKSDLRSASRDNLAKLAVILNKYADTNILVEGHTDSTGPDDYNLRLSRDRAQAVSAYLAAIPVSASRFTTQGYGETQPIASNGTVDGRQANRRVDVAIMANEKLKKIAREKSES